MATVGQTLTAPETGWKRYDDADPRIQYTGFTRTTPMSGQYYKDTIIATNVTNSKIEFKFYGTKIRIIDTLNTDRSNSMNISIDGVNQQSYSLLGSILRQVLVYEKTGLNLGIHEVIITNNSPSTYFGLDAIDIDSTGDLLGIGIQLTTPESGWRRYDDADSRIKYKGLYWNRLTSSNYFNTTHMYNYISTTNLNGITTDTISFKFYGTKLRLISTIAIDRCSDIDVNIDGIDYQYSDRGTTLYETLVFEQLNLVQQIHTVIINQKTTIGYFGLDALDIDDTGYLLHPTLNQVSDINSMQEGDCIPCRYTASTSGQAGYFSELGTCIKDEIPVTGTATPDGLFYLIKTDKGTLVADRVIQTSISWDTLNNAKYIEGSINNNYIDALPTMTSYNSPYGLVSSSGEYNIYWLAWQAFNKVYDAYGWIGNIINGGWVQYSYPKGSERAITKYALKSHPGDNYPRYPRSWTLQASNTGDFVGEQVILDTRTGESFTSKGQIREFICNNPPTTKYNYYRIVITNSGGYEPCIADIWFYEKPLDGSYFIRSMSGGCAYADAKSNSSLTNANKGAWPTNNEWDKYIVNSDLKGKITKGDDNIWHWNSIYSWMKETPINGSWNDGLGHTSTSSNTTRIVRGILNAISWGDINYGTSNNVNNTLGFRPVLNYVESDIQSEVIY